MSRKEQDKNVEKHHRLKRQSEIHARNVVSGSSSNDPRTLKYIVENKNLPELKDDSLDYFLNKIISTANLSEEETEGIEWENEIAMLRRKQVYPPEYGLTGHLRGFAFADADAYLMPLDKFELIKQQGLATLSKLAVTRSEEFVGVETSTRDVNETIVNDEESSSSGGLGNRLKE